MREREKAHVEGERQRETERDRERDRQRKRDTETPVWREVMPRPLTSAHAVVVSQHVARGTHALVGTKSIDTAEGTQQGVQRALVDIWGERDEYMSILSYKNNCTIGWYIIINNHK